MVPFSDVKSLNKEDQNQLTSSSLTIQHPTSVTNHEGIVSNLIRNRIFYIYSNVWMANSYTTMPEDLQRKALAHWTSNSKIVGSSPTRAE